MMHAINEKSAPAWTLDAASENTLRAEFTPAQKRLATLSLTSEFAHAGHTVYQIAPSGFIVSRWGYTRHCPNLYCLATLARQMGVIHG
jgi:3,4-dihydroxy-2-butanone 4-phosphate synthase